MDRRKALAALALTLLAGCTGGRPLVVGSKNFTEQLILGEIVAQHVEARLGVAVERRLNLGGTLLAHQALVSGAIDLYPEYTGTALTAVLVLPPSSDPKAVFDQIAREYRERFQVLWLPPLGFDNSFAMVIRGADARRYVLETISDAARHPEGWTLGIGYEFQRRPDGLPALDRTYSLPWAKPPATMDLGLLYRALEQGQVTMVAASATDGLLSKLDVKVLEDDRGAFPPYEAAIAVRRQALEGFPGLREDLLELSGAISEEAMRQMNYQVDAEHRPIPGVAAAFLSGLPAQRQ